jgi:hypothetical protein
MCPTHRFHSIQILSLGHSLAVTPLSGSRGMRSTRSSVKRAHGSTLQGPCLSTWSPLWLTRWRPGRIAGFSILSSSSHTRKMLRTTSPVDITQVWHVPLTLSYFPENRKCFCNLKCNIGSNCIFLSACHCYAGSKCSWKQGDWNCKGCLGKLCFSIIKLLV